MTRDSTLKPFIKGLCVCFLILTGCAGTPDSRFYLLESLRGSSVPPRAAAAESSFLIGVGPVSVPDYLDRPQIVTRSNLSTVQLAEFDRWAEPLTGNISRTLAENLSFLLHNDNVLSYPWPTSVDVTYQVLIEVYRFDGVLGERARLDAQWSIQGRKGEKVCNMKRSTFEEPVNGASFQAMVVSQSRALADFSREIASALQNLPLENIRK